MAVVTDFANIAAAQAAGYTLETWSITSQVPGRINRTQANCLTSLNAVRRERYAGAPGDPSGATVVAQYPDGTVPTPDVN